MAPKSTNKALGFPVLRALDPAKAGNLIKPWGNGMFGETTFGLVARLSGPADRLRDFVFAAVLFFCRCAAEKLKTAHVICIMPILYGPRVLGFPKMPITCAG